MDDEPNPPESSSAGASGGLDEARGVTRDRACEAAPRQPSRLSLVDLPVDSDSTAAKVVRAAEGSITTPGVAHSYSGFRAQLIGRVLVLTGDDGTKYADIVDDVRSGQVIGGKKALAELRAVRAAYPERVLAVDPWRSEKAFASEDTPFALEVDDDDALSFLAPPTLEDYLRAQLHAGATFAVTPTGVMRAGDRRSLKKAVKEVNALARHGLDIVFYVPLEPGWFTPDSVDGLIGVLAQCVHPVAIAVADANGDPYTNVLSALRATVAALPYAIAWRVDLAGLDLVAHGAKAASVGVLPAKRAAAVPGTVRRSTNRTDKRPQLLRPELLRYMRTSYMRDELYAATDPPLCWCTVCHGRPVDRFTKSTASRLEAHRHNAVGVNSLIESVTTPVGAKAWWRGLANDAVAEHTALGGQIGRKLAPPASVDAFADC